MREFTVVIEQDEDGIYIASVPELPGCHTQAETLDELNRRIKEAIELYFEVENEGGEKEHLDFVGI
ncbi:type II toxin-antitoxin system HicB family antitoxin [Methanosarcina mazei]|jgi:predicted RNase H-like HicB family nuclease|uniref:type II toxin-antitoxin system HicB family antitoxin n=1 Tax=Methanosarcina mazei TaxID=2209 RepID=UPI00064FF441|nr:type II toxin-antitoxin system HicB family antitoxin [Methanosarcina mazei]MDY0245574.1 type II toxin-antitoxin system HicB family antitoxin [Methanosarcina mazei]